MIAWTAIIAVGVVLGWAWLMFVAWSGTTLMFPPFGWCLDRVVDHTSSWQALMILPFAVVAAVGIVCVWCALILGVGWVAWTILMAAYGGLS